MVRRLVQLGKFNKNKKCLKTEYFTIRVQQYKISLKTVFGLQ